MAYVDEQGLPHQESVEEHILVFPSSPFCRFSSPTSRARFDKNQCQCPWPTCFGREAEQCDTAGNHQATCRDHPLCPGCDLASDAVHHGYGKPLGDVSVENESSLASRRLRVAFVVSMPVAIRSLVTALCEDLVLFFTPVAVSGLNGTLALRENMFQLWLCASI